jgi:glycine cleavage system H lipoate-binding protein
MRCPFLREAQVKYCQGSPIKKMIVRMPSDAIHERCSSSEYVHCSSLKQHHEDRPQQERCPFLQESLVQYCDASSVTKYVPYSESSIIRCGNDGHHYCDLYLSIAAPHDGTIKQDAMVDGIHLPQGLSYSANHMWLDQTEDGMCHIGVDAFLTKIVEHIDALHYITSHGFAHPTLVLTVHGVDLQLVFPLSVQITGTNSYLRVNLQKLVSHPYSSGWLFEGMIHEKNQPEQSPMSSPNLLKGKEADAWMKREVQHLNEFIHNQVIPNHAGGQPVMMDGGAVHEDFLTHLTRQEVLLVFNEFFSPYAR